MATRETTRTKATTSKKSTTRKKSAASKKSTAKKSTAKKGVRKKASAKKTPAKKTARTKRAAPKKPAPKIMCVSGLVGRARTQALGDCCGAWGKIVQPNIQRKFAALFITEYRKKHGGQSPPASWIRIVRNWPEDEIHLVRETVLHLCRNNILDEPTVKKASGIPRTRIDVRVRRKKAELVITFYHNGW